MAKGDIRKPVKTRQYIKKEEDFREEAEIDQDFRAKAAHHHEESSMEEMNEVSDAELLRRFRTSLTSNILPQLPNIPGFHLCWVPISSNNIYDTVDHRKNIGYSVVKPEEVPNFLPNQNRSAQTEGCVSYNELVLMKIPEKLYQLYMVDSHHTQPMEQERVIKQTIAAMEDNRGSNIARDQSEMTGINSLARKVKEPNFI